MNIPAWASDPANVRALGAVEKLVDVEKGYDLENSPIKSSSQSREDTYLYKQFFFGKKEGTFVEIGGLDGHRYSNTLRLEKALGWKGMLLEASPSLYSKLKVNRNEQLTVHAAVCKTTRVVHWADSYGKNKKKGSATGGILEFMSASYVGRFLTPEVRAIPMQQMQCVPLGPVLEMAGLTKINFFSLDVEGAEFEIVQSIDFSKVKVDVFCVEADSFNTTKNELVRTHLRKNGFTLYDHRARDGNNDWFIRKGFVPFTEPGRPIPELAKEAGAPAASDAAKGQATGGDKQGSARRRHRRR